jgi:biopolymer transport protein ExbD
MNLKPRRREDPEINITSLIDVVLLLLIFFMITTTFEREAQLQVSLPEASTEPAEQKDAKALEITINVNGDFFINEQQVLNPKPETLRRAILQTIGERRDLPVIVRADARSPVQSVVTAMDVTGQLGLTQLSLATSQPPAEAGK